MNSDSNSQSKVLQNAYDELRSEAESALGMGQVDGVKRVAVPIDNVDPLLWLRGQTGRPRLYWSGRGGELQSAGVGCSWQILGDAGDLKQVLDTIGALLELGSDLRVYGGFRFAESTCVDDLWSTFGHCRFMLPAIEMCRANGKTSLCCNLTLEAGEEVLRLLREIEVHPGRPDIPFPTVLSRSDTPDRSGWTRNVNEATDAIERGEMEKIVLARRASLEFAEEHHAVTLLERLQQGTPGCFHFLFDGEDGKSFIGASPERLYRRSKNKVFSEAVAGTRPMGSSTAASDRLGRELLASDKDLREHFFVRDHIRDRLTPLCREVEVDQPVELLKLARGQHLFTALSGTLAEGVTDARLLSALHPTPAVGGSPTEIALEKIAAAEDFDRGWYAAPVGWISAEGAEFAVAIRSGLLEKRSLHLYSGAGIVKGSTPDAEWEEIEHKISDFIKVLTGE